MKGPKFRSPYHFAKANTQCGQMLFLRFMAMSSQACGGIQMGTKSRSPCLVLFVLGATLSSV